MLIMLGILLIIMKSVLKPAGSLQKVDGYTVHCRQ